jgi:hypothetical protein
VARNTVTEQERKRTPAVLLWTIAAIAVLAAVLGGRFVFGSPSFDADKIAGSEARMWQAYYSGDKAQLGLLLMDVLRSQYGLSLLQSKKIASRLAEAAMEFHSARGDYARIVLPDLIEAYRLIGESSGLSFDPEAAARAELAWWVARRTPGQNSAEQVGGKMAELYALLYGGDHPSLRRAGLLRAQAAALRDSGGAAADWRKVESLLRESYREVQKAIPGVSTPI